MESSVKKCFSTIIRKTVDECKRMKQICKGITELAFQVSKENEGIAQDKIMIVPSYLPKGLEFGAVMVATINESFEPV